MKVCIQVGRSGSGKTKAMIEQILAVNEKGTGPVIYLLPDQANLSGEQRIMKELSRKGKRAVTNLSITSFNRLAELICEKEGKGVPVVVDHVAKSMLIQKALLSVAPELTLYKSEVVKQGFSDKMRRIVQEMIRNQITPQELLEAADTVKESRLKSKLTDIARVLSKVLFVKEDRVLPEELLFAVAPYFAASEWLSGVHVFVDEFDDFSPAQKLILEHLMCRAGSFTINVTADPKDNLFGTHEPYALFDRGLSQIDFITRTAQKNGHDPVLVPFFTGEEKERTGAGKSPELCFLEREFDHEGAVYPDKCQNVRLVLCANRRQEAGVAADEIRRLVREGYRYREIAVVTGDIAGFAPYLTEQFSVAGIPFFLDQTVKLSDNPLVKALVFGAAIAERFDRNAVFRFVKSGFLSLKNEEDLLTSLDEASAWENYCLACGLTTEKRLMGSYTMQKSGMTEGDLMDLMTIRDEFLAPVLRFKYKRYDGEKTELRFRGGKGKVSALADAWLSLLSELADETHIHTLTQICEEEKLSVKEQVILQTKEKLTELLSQIKEILGDEEMTLSAFREMVEAGIDAVKVGVIPPTLDRVLVGDLKRTRLMQARVLVLLGMNEGEFPETTDTGSLLNDRERESLKPVLKLDETDKEIDSHGNYLLYRTLSKATEKLFGTWHVLADDNSVVSVCAFGRRLSTMFSLAPENPVRDVDMRLFTELARHLRSDTREDAKKVAIISAVLDGQENKLLSAPERDYTEERLGKDVASAIFTKDEEESITRLETFAACEMHHFLAYGLFLKERPEYVFSRMDSGNLFHNTLKYVFDELGQKEGRLSLKKAEDWALAGVTAGETADEGVGKALSQIVSDSLERALDEKTKGLLSGTEEGKQELSFIRNALNVNVEILLFQLARGQFIPFGKEMSFNHVKLGQTDRTYEGKIDRLDLASCDGGTYCHILDYKSYAKELKPEEMDMGLSLQLPLYLHAILQKNPGYIPGGMFYYKLWDGAELLDDKALSYRQLSLLLKKEPDPADVKELYRKLLLRRYESAALSGMMNSTMQHVKLTDAFINETGTPLVVKGVKVKEESLANSKSLVTEEELRDRLSRMNLLAGSLKEQIDGGHIAVNPVKFDEQRTSCTFCPYASVCGFDRRLKSFSFRKIVKQDPEKKE